MILNGQLLSGDIVVAEIINGSVNPVKQKLMPLYLARGGSFEAWLVSRAVDSSRVNSRILKKMLRLKSVDDLSTVLHAHAATVTDNFWFRQRGEQLSWEEVRFTEDHYAELALSGKFLAYNDDDFALMSGTQTPELTNIGSFEKAWKLENGAWYLYKQGNSNERFSELLTFKLGKLLGFDMAEYEPAGLYIKSRDFTEGKWNFEPAASIVGDSTDEIQIYDAIKGLNPELCIPYMDIIYLDALVFNVDRHSYNYGFLRDPATGETVAMAPNFDNNLALISRGAEGSPYGTNAMLIDDFVRLLEHAKISYPKPRQIAEDEVLELVMTTLPDENVDREFVIEFLLARQSMLFESMALKGTGV